MVLTGRIEYNDNRGNSIWKIIGNVAKFLGRGVLGGLQGGAQAYLKNLNNDSGINNYGGTNTGNNTAGYNP